MGMMPPGRVFSSFGLREAWLGDLETGSSLRTSWASQAGLEIGQSLGFAVNSGIQNSPDLKKKKEANQKK